MAASESDTARVINVQFLGGTVLRLPVGVAVHVRDLVTSIKAANPPPTPYARLKLISQAAQVLDLSGASASLVGTTIHAVYCSSELGYLVKNSDGTWIFLQEDDDAWSEEMGKKSFVDEDRWVSPTESDGHVVENLAKASNGVSITASSNFFQDLEILNNLIRLGSKFGDPRYMMAADDNSFVFASDDRDPKLILDFGRTVVLTRIGSICYAESWLDYFAAESSDDGNSWLDWGTDKGGRRRDGGVVFFDREPTSARFVRMRATSGHFSGARIGPVFAYGFVGDIPVAS